MILCYSVLLKRPHVNWTVVVSLCTTGGALVDMGEAMRQMADVKDSLDISVKQNFIDPLQNLQDKDLKEITVCYSSLYTVTKLLQCETLFLKQQSLT